MLCLTRDPGLRLRAFPGFKRDGGMTESQREMVAVMFTDVSGYSALAQHNEALALRLLEIKRTIADPVIAEYHGHLIKTIGDALMVEFKSALDAARCAAALQQRLYEHNLVVPAEQQISVRIGVHMGDVVRKDGDIFGDTVNIAARVEPQAPPGGIAVTHAVYEQIRNKFELPLSGLGSFRLKGIEGGTVLYAVVLPWGPVHPKGKSHRAIPMSLYAGIGAALLAGVVGFGLWRYGTNHPATGPAAVAPAAATVAPPQSVAVLPFENLSGDPNNAYFSAGIQDEILTRLAQVGALKVVSRTSTLKYASHPENLKSVGLELGVAAVLEGSVQRAGDTARINVQLIDAATDTHLWAETYDRSMKDIFSAENDVATKIADALKAKLQPRESARIAEVPTHDAAAYDLYLQAEYLNNSIHDFLVSDKDADSANAKALKLYSDAIARDPAFMLAYAHRSSLESLIFFNGKGAALLPQARKDAEKALSLDPASPDAHLAMGYVHYYGERDYAKALEEYDLVIQDYPNDPEVYLAVGMVHRRLGEYDAAIVSFKRAADLDPANQIRYLTYIESTLVVLGRFTDAFAVVDRLAAIHPDNYQPNIERASLFIAEGKLDQAQAVLQAVSAQAAADQDFIFLSYYIARLRRDPAAMLKALSQATEPLAGDNVPVSLHRGDVYAMLHEDAKAQAEYAEAARVLEDWRKRDPESSDLWSATSNLEVSRGNKAAALEAARHAVAITPTSADALNGPNYLYNLAVVEAHVGEATAALSDLDTVLSKPYGSAISMPTLRLDPDWDPVRQDPRFDALLKKYSSVHY
jgi:TolB-like protein/class 3 adenylate cyclase/Tfp pilus assembly protein PilF